MTKKLKSAESKPESQEWYMALVDECKNIITEAVTNSRWDLIEGYWTLGKTITEDHNFQRFSKGNKTSVQGLAQNIGLSERMLYYALKAYEKYPDISTLPEGKNISWNKLITKHLPEPKERKKSDLKAINGEYNVIVIDPPWPYGTEYNGISRRVASPYEEIPLEKLKTHKLPAAEDASLWLWTTHQFLAPAIELMKEWGFEYKVTLVWNKERMGMGAWLRCQAEFCLLGIKGKPEWNLTNERDVISVARREHSRKPDEFYKMVENLTSGSRIDYFSREKRDGWDQFGNEPDKF